MDQWGLISAPLRFIVDCLRLDPQTWQAEIYEHDAKGVHLALMFIFRSCLSVLLSLISFIPADSPMPPQSFCEKLASDRDELRNGRNILTSLNENQ
jgi:hypothetical protein